MIKNCNDLSQYIEYFDCKVWTKYTNVSNLIKKYDGSSGLYQSDNASSKKNNPYLAINICTYHRLNDITRNINALLESKFFDQKDTEFYGHMHIYVTDNACEMNICDNQFLHIQHNRNTGGSGGFQKGLEWIRKSKTPFSHVVFMDDDVEFDIESFYRLYLFLLYLKHEYSEYPIAGRMFRKDISYVQYTAVEIWNKGDIRHVGFNVDMRDGNNFTTINDNKGAEYGGFWFCCYPMSFAKYNDIMPFFIHCDDVEYGLRCGKEPIILNGIQVWHETYEYRQTPIMNYYDTRNPLFVNEKYGLLPSIDIMLKIWKEKITAFHLKKDYASEYFTILGMYDFLKGISWLYKVDSCKKHKKLQRAKISRYLNSVFWRVTEWKIKQYTKKHGKNNYL